jgi:outer membrane immunogenic protein
MKRTLIAGALAFVAAAPAFAADLPPPAAPLPRAPVAYVPAVPVFTWTGFYVGLNTGYAFGKADGTSTLGTTGSFSVSGPMAGVTLGGNYQIGQFVVGAETDIDWQNVRGSQVGGGCSFIPPGGPPAVPGSCDAASNWVGTFRGRVGLAMDRVLLYATGGGAYANIKASVSALPWSRNTELGWTAGAGVEYAMTDNWTVKFEYLFADFQHATCPAASCFATSTTVSFNESMVRAGINYKFGY